ncbi:purine nucleoside phosphorylase YfiH [Enterobacter asburiae]|uniref:purine nucleoside phosphorylase YfiH n=1 Tax=Enterobacter asburiae TaxID=61645 RepID=UPI00292A7E39|nr:purine nucleoside phosphorylase YfiH [Enterobacter asburiae]MDV0912679.1 purine nucleoside phosphorylase YfiH [Enterobacter asburiae]MDV0932391.1 purine nucleoside phosphorylase YfiH [Enterobacter asburiae]MDV0943287.1 purine nucleoside phosphorylase YfiH [Enterobacter asburiae]MDV0992306.1 purine nucleoside phosphorylase YfiH [Enterobacter asburiae]MDV1000394.1 purine nucleoside phosphorylase YfiH [Enterobacter asburiae]
MTKLIVPEWPLPAGVAACSSTRIGGVSQGAWESLNLGAHCGDNLEHVEENRRRLFAAGNLPSKPVWLEQVHGNAVLKLTGEPYASKRADASYSNTPGTVCAVMTADCLSVLFCNRAGTEVAAAHAGWRGLCEGVLEETVACFSDEPANIMVWLGPAIGPRAFEVGPEVREAFMEKDPQAVEAFLPSGDKYLADIYQLARQRLNNVGVTQIFGGDRCTFTEKGDFFSYRRDKTTGRMASFIWLI